MRKQLLNIFLIGFLVFSCSLEDRAVAPEPPSSLLTPLAEYETNVAEPSGLTLGLNNACLWTVSDNTNHVYKLSLDGKILKELTFQGNDLEGITFDFRDSTLWVAEEQLRQLVHIDTNGTELARFDIKNLEGHGNSGIEGVCLGNDSLFRVLNEKSPSLWAKLNKDFSAQKVVEIKDVEDISGICNAGNNNYWIVSDQSRKFFKWSPSKGVISASDLKYEKAEGVAVDSKKKRVYIVSDKTGKLYTYEIKNIL